MKWNDEENKWQNKEKKNDINRTWEDSCECTLIRNIRTVSDRIWAVKSGKNDPEREEREERRVEKGREEKRRGQNRTKGRWADRKDEKTARRRGERKEGKWLGLRQVTRGKETVINRGEERNRYEIKREGERKRIRVEDRRGKER